MDCSSSRANGARRAISISFRTTLLVCLGLAIVVTVPGCGGCFRQDPLAKKKKEEEEKKKKKEKPKKNFEVERLRVKPHDPAEARNLVKAGHWMAATLQAKANNFNFQAELDSASTKRGGQPFEVPNTAFRIKMSRPASLPKGQTKHFETLYFIPSLPAQDEGYQGSRTIWLENKLRARRGGGEVISRPEPTSTMPHFQYFFVVLSDDPDRYGYLNTQKMDPILPPVDTDEDGLEDRVLHYKVLLPKIENRVPVPNQPLTWTSIAYVLWDGLNPRLLTPPQQRALMDWLHWGGQIIISGPNSMDLLRGSFLEKYLPALGGNAVSLRPQDFEELAKGWSVLDQRTNKKAFLNIIPDKPPVGVELTKAPDAEFLSSTGELVVEKRVGSGRIVVTRFSLTDRQIVNWGSYKSFFNGCLLRRPHRTFKLSGQTSVVEVEWANWPGDTNVTDARATTGLRYFTRDGTSAFVKEDLPVVASEQHEVAGWNDSSGVAHASRQSLRDAAGISVPDAAFVFQVLAVYLLVLAPVNWAVFRVIGRVEWAWVAAPLIAIVGGVAIVRLAQLDIGFARSRTELAVLELHGGYSRGHLTRYTALYTSLSEAYDLLFDDESALAMPFPEEVPYVPGVMDRINTVQFRRDKQVSLSGFQVTSNDTGLVHSEQMHNAGGSIDLVGDADKGWMVRNGCELNLKDIGVFGKSDAGQLQLAWIGSLEAGKSVPLDMQPAPADDVHFGQWSDSLACYSYERQQQDVFDQFDGNNDKALSRKEVEQHAELTASFAKVDEDRDGRLSEKEVYQWSIDSREGELTLGRLFELACQKDGLNKGDVRLAGWTDEDLPGLTISPRASQKILRTMVLVHLKRGKLPDAQPDTNLLTELEPEPGKIDDLEN
ncbi:MAG: EF-hand domain-containing protein [Planctomycetes bacterium]|nr:EF-hand domain-containing protein [Planctomycetota bacterium]MBL7043651.1 EF-hand domain-containing protein [Pirellulaceae bacterium]